MPKSITVGPAICPSIILFGVPSHLPKPTEDVLDQFTQNINHSGRDFCLDSSGHENQ